MKKRHCAPKFCMKQTSHPVFSLAKNRRTTVKTRIVAHNQHVVRIDQENTRDLLEEEEVVILKKSKQLSTKLT